MAFSAARITRLGVIAIPRQRYGSFAGKTATEEIGEKFRGFIANVGRMMRG